MGYFNDNNGGPGNPVKGLVYGYKYKDEYEDASSNKYELYRPEINFDFNGNNYIPSNKVCKNGVAGCSYYSSRRFVDLTRGQVAPITEDAWFLQEANISRGGDLIYKGTGDDISDYYDKFQVGDYVEFDRAGTSKIHKKSKVNPNYVNTGSEHSGIIVGFSNGYPIVEHSSKNNDVAYRDVLNPTVSRFLHEYKPVAVFRNPVISKDNIYLKYNLKKKKAWEKNKKDYVYSSNVESVKDWEKLYKEEVRDLLGENNSLTSEQLDKVFKRLIGLGVQESNLDNEVFFYNKDSFLKDYFNNVGSFLKQSIIENSTPLVSLHHKINSGDTITKEQAKANIKFNKKYGLKPMPHPSIRERDFILAEAKLGRKMTEEEKESYKTKYKSLYRGKPEHTKHHVTTPSVGAFKAKLSANDAWRYGITNGKENRASTITSTNNSYYGNKKNQLINSMLLLIEGLNTKKYSFDEALDRSVIKYNAPSKERNKDIMDFFYYGKGNPDHNKYNIDYLTNIKEYERRIFGK